MHGFPRCLSRDECSSCLMLAARERGTPLCPCCRCPPGHGDIYPSLLGSGMLDRLSKAGVKYLFVSNSDNLGATLDVSLLSYFAQSDKAFIMEVRLFAAVTLARVGPLVNNGYASSGRLPARSFEGALQENA